MKKLILTSLAALALLPAALPSAAMAQSAAEVRHSRQDVREQRRDLRDAKRDYRQDVRDYNRAHPWGRAPFKYNRFTIGARIQPVYFGPRYAVADWRRFHWAAPAANQRWVRHYDDALLVNVRTGRVVKVIYNAFR